MSSLHEQSLLLDVPRACIAASLCLALAGCVTSNATPTAGVAPLDATDTVHNTDFSPRFPLASEGKSGRAKGIHAALYLSWLRHAAGTAARSRSGDAVCVAAAGRISQGRRRRNEFRRRRCADGREDPSRRYSSAQFRRRSACPGQCDAGVGRSDSAQGRAVGIRKRLANAKCRRSCAPAIW